MRLLVCAAQSFPLLNCPSNRTRHSNGILEEVPTHLCKLSGCVRPRAPSSHRRSRFLPASREGDGRLPGHAERLPGQPWMLCGRPPVGTTGRHPAVPHAQYRHDDRVPFEGEMREGGKAGRIDGSTRDCRSVRRPCHVRLSAPHVGIHLCLMVRLLGHSVYCVLSTRLCDRGVRFSGLRVC
jgi:hypothetical protein